MVWCGVVWSLMVWCILVCCYVRCRVVWYSVVWSDEVSDFSIIIVITQFTSMVIQTEIDDIFHGQ